MFVGTVHGVVLNDRAQRRQLSEAFEAAPYGRAPGAPVLYIKPRNCVCYSPAVVTLDDDLDEVEAAPTLGLLFGRDTCRTPVDESLDYIAGACLVIDVCEPHASYHRPAIRQRARDGFLPIGAFAPFDEAIFSADVTSWVDGALVHRWTAQRLVRGAAQLIADISAFMTLSAGDLLLVGLPGDAPRVRRGDRLDVRSSNLPTVSASFAGRRT